MDFNEKQNLITRAIDTGAWKYSWHVKRTKAGYIDLYDSANVKHMLDVVKLELSGAINRLVELDSVISILEECLGEALELEQADGEAANEAG
jgi:hypothetical protein